MITPNAEVIARIDRLELAARTIVEGYLAGRHRSPRQGFAVEFAQHREYSPGDDLRHIDWKVFGRTERHHIKQYEQETNLAAWLLVDASESMSFASGERSKFDVATTIAAALAILVNRQSDAIGVATFAAEIIERIRPSAHPATVRNVLRVLAGTTVPGTANLGIAVDGIAEQLGRRGIVIIISDFFDDVATLEAAIKHLKYHHHDIALIQVLDAAEIDFPYRHATLFRGLESLGDRTADPVAIRDAYLANFQEHQTDFHRMAKTHAIDVLTVRTDADIGRSLAEYLHRRA
jgi:uncharacterized protein (DUF58 family)